MERIIHEVLRGFASRLLLVVAAATLCIMGCATEKKAPLTDAIQERPTPVQTEYVLQPGDVLDIKFYYNPELNEHTPIRPDGKICLQLIDEISAAGLTPSELSKTLLRCLRENTSAAAGFRHREGASVSEGICWR